MSTAQAAPERAVLVIDDDDVTLATYAAALRVEGYEIVTCRSSATALQAAEARAFAVILIDLRLPTADDGLALLRRIRSLPEHRTTPLAIVTGEYEIDRRVEAEIAKHNAAIAFKPMWLPELVSLVKQLDPAIPEG